MSKPTIRIHNVETNEVIDREMTNSEFKQYEADQLAEALAISEAKAAAKAATAAKAAAQVKLAEIGLTVEDLTALGL